MTRDCKHGQLARSCQLCEYEQEIERLQKQIDDDQKMANSIIKEHQQRIEELESCQHDNWATIRLLNYVVNVARRAPEEIGGE